MCTRAVRFLGMQCPSDGANRAVDVVIGFCLKALREGVVFVMADVLAGFPEIVEGGMQPARLVRGLIHPRVVVQVLSVIDGSLFDLLIAASIRRTACCSSIVCCQSPGRCSIIQRAARRSDSACK